MRTLSSCAHQKGHIIEPRSVLVLGAILWLSLPVLAYAHGSSISTVRVDNDFGPYHLVVITSSQGSARTVRLTLILTEKSDGNEQPQPILGAKVQATFEFSGTNTSELSVNVPTESRLADSGYYESIVTVPSDGDWNVRLGVDGPAGTALVAFPLPISSAFDWIDELLCLVPFGLIALLFLYQKWIRSRANIRIPATTQLG
jgi:hypothetical protein